MARLVSVPEGLHDGSLAWNAWGMWLGGTRPVGNGVIGVSSPRDIFHRDCRRVFLETLDTPL